MLRAAHNKTLLLLEGGSDEKLMTAFIDEDQCDLVVSWGRENIISAMPIVHHHGVKGVVAIVDQDYDALLGKPISIPNVIVCEERDIETLMFRSHAFNRTIIEIGSKPKISASIKSGVHPRDKIMNIAFYLGLLRVVSAHEEIFLKFKGLNYRYIDRKNLNFNVADMISEVYNNSQKKCLDIDRIIGSMKSWESKEIDKWKFCCGHDLSAIFGKSLSGCFGSNAISKDEIESRLRSSFSEEMFKATKIYAGIKSWEISNKNFVCLKNSL